MSTKITDTEMTSDLTRHAARAADGGWAVSWLPGRTLTRDEAITAMTIAEAVAEHADDLADPAHKLWWHMNGWAAELGLSGPCAVAEASLSPEDHAAMPRVRVILPEPGLSGHLVALDRAAGVATIRLDGGETVTMDAARLQYAARSAASGGGL